MSPGALARTIRQNADQAPGEGDGRTPRRDVERCDLCSAPVQEQGHRHLLEIAAEQLLCACRPCSLLFVREAAGAGNYRLIPQRRRRLDPVPTSSLGVPVGLAFFVPCADGSVRAHYPSPAGATRWEVDPGAWQETLESCPELATLAADVEALLVNTVQGREQHWIVPLDDCFRMVAVVRREWRGLSGGSRVWPEIDRFFAELTEQQG